MKYFFKKISFVFLLFSGARVFAQNGTVAGGGDANGSGGSASYSYGQVVYTTNTNAVGSVAQGVQQTYEITVITDLSETFEIASELNAYPNPTPDRLTLAVKNTGHTDLRYELCDILGRLLVSEKVEADKTLISLENFKQGSYLLKLVSGTKEVKTFKIIKN